VPAPQPEEIYEQTREEGKRRLSRPLVELAATALVGGFDVAFGVAALALAGSAAQESWGRGAGTLAAAVAFGVAFVFIVVGRSELFTENFLVPLTATSRDRASVVKLLELGGVTLVVNITGGILLVLVLTSQGVIPGGAQDFIVRFAEHVNEYGVVTGFLSALLAGGLMTLMTWFVEGAARSVGVRIVMGWIVGAVLVLGSFNHSIVSTIELVTGMRYGANISVGDVLLNLVVAVVGNLAGGLGFVTLTRAAQARSVS
jgi:formate/nitrite transporter FocA (FNT family)